MFELEICWIAFLLHNLRYIFIISLFFIAGFLFISKTLMGLNSGDISYLHQLTCNLYI